MTTIAGGRPLPVESLPLPSIASELPAAPSAALDAYLDAAAACFARHGISRTAVPDIARELGVSRTTVYRQIGTVEEAARLLLARELRRFLASLPTAVDGVVGPESVTRLMAAIVRFGHDHPVLSKILADEPELIGPYLTRELGELVDRVSAMIVPLLERAMTQGLLWPRDPAMLAEFLIRTTISLLVAPPSGDVLTYLEQTVLPLLNGR